VDNPLAPDRERARERAMTRITLVGMASNIGLTVVKLIAGIVGNSVAMLADAVHSVSDLLTDFVTLWASKVSHKPKDISHPYGHGKFESLGALIISGLLVGTGVGIGWHAIENMQLIMSGKGLGSPTGIALIGAIISIGVKEIIYRETIKVADKYDSKVIRANAWHHRSDAVSSVVALIGVIGGMAKVPIIDPIAGLFVSGLIVKAAVELAWDSLKDLTDQNVSPQILSKAENILSSMFHEGVLSFHQLRGRRMGPYLIFDVHVVVDPRLNVTVSHQIAEKVRARIINEMPAVSEVLVHIDPANTQHASNNNNQINENTNTPSSPSPTNEFMRSQSAIEQDVRAVLADPEFSSQILGLTHFTCHFISGELSVQLELIMNENLTIHQAREIAQRLDQKIKERVKDISTVDCHLELTDSHINQTQSQKKIK